MQFPRNEASANAAVWPIGFVSKSPTSTETPCRNIEREAIGTIHGLEKFQKLLLHL